MILEGNSQDYCLEDRVNISCPGNDVIVATKALYGRMRTGKCVDASTNLNCDVSVLSEVDERCSGRTQCNFDVTVFANRKPCKKDYTPYLELAYKCVKGQNSSIRLTLSHNPFPTSFPSLLLFIKATLDSSHLCPHLICFGIKQENFSKYHARS